MSRGDTQNAEAGAQVGARGDEGAKDILHLTQIAVAYTRVSDLVPLLEAYAHRVLQTGAMPFPRQGDPLLFLRSNPGGGGPCAPTAVKARFVVPAGANVCVIGILHTSTHDFGTAIGVMAEEIEEAEGTVIAQEGDVAGVVTFQAQTEPWLAEVPFTLVPPQAWPKMPQSTPR